MHDTDFFPKIQDVQASLPDFNTAKSKGGILSSAIDRKRFKGERTGKRLIPLTLPFSLNGLSPILDTFSEVVK